MTITRRRSPRSSSRTSRGIPIIQPYEDYGLLKYVEWTPNPNQQFELRRFNFKRRRA